MYHYLQIGAWLLGGISYFIIYPIFGVTVFKYIGFIGVMMAGIFPVMYYLKFKEIHFDDKICRGREAILVVIMNVVAVIIILVVFL